MARKRGIHLGTILTYLNYIHEEIWNRLNLDVTIPFRIFLSLSVIYGLKLYKAIISGVVLYGCETWSLVLREEYAWNAYENSLLRITFEPKEQKEPGISRKQHSEVLNTLYSPRNITSMIKLRSI
jgi:hypothetical protein